MSFYFGVAEVTPDVFPEIWEKDKMILINFCIRKSERTRPVLLLQEHT